jgi:hypothetical protein
MVLLRGATAAAHSKGDSAQMQFRTETVGALDGPTAIGSQRMLAAGAEVHILPNIVRNC